MSDTDNVHLKEKVMQRQFFQTLFKDNIKQFQKFELKKFTEQESLIFLDSLVNLDKIQIQKDCKRFEKFQRIFEKGKGNLSDMIKLYQSMFKTSISPTTPPKNRFFQSTDPNSITTGIFVNKTG